MKIICSTLVSLVLFISVAAQNPKLNLVRVATGFSSPVDLKNCGDDRIFVVEQGGRIKIMDKQGNISARPFLDIHLRVLSTGNEQGLLGLAFSPNYKQDGYFYVNYTTGSGSGSTVISRFRVSAIDSNHVDSTTEQVLLTFTQPFTNHNGGNLMFGPDGYLYDSQGDGGNSSTPDPNGNGQNKNVYLGKILRFDVSNPDTTYTIPATNPFANDTGVKPEIWAYGLRNPWRCSFDRLTGDQWIGDVGQNLYEEIDFQPAADTGGENYGWRCYEGNHTFNSAGCAGSGFTFPVYEYVHSSPNGCAVVGGYVYRGTRFGNLFGRYLFTDFCSGRFWDIRQTSPGVFATDTLQSFLTNQYGAFGEDNDYELYITGRTNGNIYHITDTSTCNPVAFITFSDTISHCDTVHLAALADDSLSYQWYNSNGSINGAEANTLAVTHSGWYKVYVAKPQIGCASVSDSVYADVHHDDLTLCSQCPLALCNEPAPFSLNSYFTPAGGVYTGNGITNDSIFTPSGVGNGSDTLIYTYHSSFGCVTTAPLIFQLGDSTVLTILTGGYPDVCVSASPFSLVTDAIYGPPGGIFYGIGVSNDSIFDPASAGIGEDTVYYKYTNASGCSSVGVTFVRVDTCTGINKIQNDISFSIFPNPGSGQFHLSVSINAPQLLDMMVVDALGKICYKRTYAMGPSITNTLVDFSNFSKGVYMVQLKGTAGCTVKRLVIN